MHIETSIKFEFLMDSLGIELFTGGSKMLKTENSPLHLPEKGLAKFGLTQFSVKGRMFADGLLTTNILLMNCTLDDTRQSRQGSLVRIMERTTEFENEADSKPIRSMIDVTLRKGPTDMFGNFLRSNIFSFYKY